MKETPTIEPDAFEAIGNGWRLITRFPAEFYGTALIIAYFLFGMDYTLVRNFGGAAGKVSELHPVNLLFSAFSIYLYGSYYRLCCGKASGSASHGTGLFIGPGTFFSLLLLHALLMLIGLAIGCLIIFPLFLLSTPFFFIGLPAVVLISLLLYGIYFSLKLTFVYPLLVMTSIQPWGAIKISWRLMSGRIWFWIRIYLAAGLPLVGLVAVLALIFGTRTAANLADGHHPSLLSIGMLPVGVFFQVLVQAALVSEFARMFGNAGPHVAERSVPLSLPGPDTDDLLTDCSGKYMINRDLRGKSFENHLLCEASMEDTNLSGANFRGSDLTRARMMRADLSAADFTGATLARADLSDALMLSANFSGTDLSGARMGKANAKDAVFRDCDLSGVDFSLVQGLSVDQFADTVGLDEALFSDEFLSALKQAFPRKFLE